MIKKDFKKQFKLKLLTFFAGISVLFAPIILSLLTVNNNVVANSSSMLNSVSDIDDSKQTKTVNTQDLVKKIPANIVDGWFQNNYLGVLDLEKYDAAITLYSNKYVWDSSYLNDTGGPKESQKYWLKIYSQDGKICFDMPNNVFSDADKSSFSSLGADWAIAFQYFLNNYADQSVFKANFDPTEATSSNGIPINWAINTQNSTYTSNLGSTFLSDYRSQTQGTFFEGVLQIHTALWGTQGAQYNEWAGLQVMSPARGETVNWIGNFKYISTNFSEARSQQMFGDDTGEGKIWNYYKYPDNNKWRSLRYFLGLYDGKVWFCTDTNRTKSRIDEFSYKKEVGDKVPLNSFLAMQSSELKDYFNVTLFNTPSNAVLSDIDNLNITLTNDPINRKVIAKLTIPRSFVPINGFNVSANINNPQWISDTDMVATIDLAYDDYFILGSVEDTRLNTDIFTDHGDHYSLDVSTLPYVPFLDYDAGINAIKNDLFETILSSWASVLWINLPNGIVAVDDNGWVSVATDYTDYTNGKITLSEINLFKYWENNTLVTGHKKGFLTKNLELTGFNRLPTTVNTSNISVGSLSVDDNVIVWDATNCSDFSNYANTLPSDFNPETVINAQYLKNNILNNLPSEYNDSSYTFVEKQPDDAQGTLTFKFNLSNFNNQQGELETTPKTFTIKFIGLSKRGDVWNSNFLTSSGQYIYELSEYDSLQNNIFSLINKNIIQAAINDNLKYYLPNTKDGESLVVDSITPNQPESSITVNAHIVKQNTQNINLPPLTITNFVFAPIVAKTSPITINQLPAEFLWSIQNSYNTDNTAAALNTSTQIISKLSQLYDGLDDSKYTVSIDINKCNVNNLTGLLSLQLNIQYKQSLAEINLVNTFRLSGKLGVSQLAKTYYADENKTSQDLFEYLKDPVNVNTFFSDSSNGIINPDGIPSLGPVEYSLQDLRYDNKVITTNVYMRNAVSFNSYIPSFDSPYLLGTITLVGNDYTSAQLNQTLITQSNNYLTNQLFSNVQTPSQFKNVVNDNMNDQNFLKTLINVQNAPENATISIEGGDINNNTISYTFSVSPIINVNGQVSNEPLTNTYTYTLPYGDNITIVNPLIELDGSKYAFEYSVEDLQTLNVVQTLPEGVTPSITINEVNNLTRTITATVTASQYYNESGIVTNNLSQPVIFTNAKKVAEPTIVQRNNTDISEDVNEFKEILDSKDKTILGKYIEITPINVPNTEVEWEIASYDEVANNFGIFNVTINLTNNYFKNDDKFTFVQDNSPTSFVIKFAVYPPTNTVQQIVGKTLTVNQAASAGLTGLTNEDFSIDFESEYGNQLEDAFKNNLTAWFSNAVNLSNQLGNRSFILSKNIAYDNDTVTINASVLGWNESLIQNDPLQPTNVTVKITGFNQTATTANSSVDISQVDSLHSLSVNDSSLSDALKQYIEQNKQQCFKNYPDAMTINGSITISNPNTDNGSVNATVNVVNAKLQSNYGSNTFTIQFIGFKKEVNSTSGKTLTVTQAANVGLTGISTDDYSFDFQIQYGDAITALLNNANNMSNWFNNVPSVEQINNQSVIQTGTSLTFTPTNIQGNPAVQISGSFISFNSSGDARDPLEYTQQIVTITGFSKITTSTTSLDINQIANNTILPGDEMSLQTAVEKLNGDLKNSIKNSLKTVLVQNVVGKTNNFADKLNQAIDSGNFTFTVSGNNISLAIQGVPVVSNNGTTCNENDSLTFTINTNNKFNSVNLISVARNTDITYSETLFNNIFPNQSKFYYDWQVNESADLSLWSNQLKDYMNNNIESFINVNGTSNASIYYPNIMITSLILTDNNNNGYSVSFNYNGYQNGDLVSNLSGQFNIVLKLMPTEEEITNSISLIISQYVNKYNLSDESSREQVLNTVVSEINNKLNNILPQSIIPANGFVSNNDFTIGDNSLSLQEGAITITYYSDPKNSTGETQLNVPKKSLVINGKYIPTSLSKSNNWIFYAILGGWAFIILLSLIILIAISYKRKNKNVDSDLDIN